MMRSLRLLGPLGFSLLLTAMPASALESAAQRMCLAGVSKGFARVSKAEGKLAAACVKAAATGKLAPMSVAGCLAADADQKVASARSKASAAIAKVCSEAPDFGLSDPTGVASAAVGLRGPLLQKLFGTAIEDALALKTEDSAAAGCQAAVVKAVDRCWSERVAAYGACASAGLATTIADATSLGACRDVDANEKVADACGAGIAGAVAAKCDGVDLTERLPGCECQATSECIRVRVANSLNAALSVAAELPEAATVLPYARRLQRETGSPWISPVYGEYVASRVVGREEDAPLACPLGAVNIYTIQDAQADADYNAAILPLILDQGVRVLFTPATPTDLTGTSPVGLVQGTQAMPLYGSGDDFVHLATRLEVFPLVDLKHREVGDTLHFGFEHCLYDCEAIYAFHALPPIEFTPRLLVVHFHASREAIEDAVAGLAAEAPKASSIRLRWVGRAVADFHLELASGDEVQAFHKLDADGSLIYELDPGVDASADVLTLPALSSFLATSTDEAVIVLQ